MIRLVKYTLAIIMSLCISNIAWAVNNSVGNSEKSVIKQSRVILKENVHSVDGERINLLTQDMLYAGKSGNRVPNDNTIFVIQHH